MDLAGLSDAAALLWKSVGGLLNSPFVSASLSALAGAGLGVWGAQRVALRASLRTELMASLRQLNALTILATTISNQAMSLKNQHIDELVARYLELRDKALLFDARARSVGSTIEIFEFSADLVHVVPISAPIEAVKNFAYSGQLISGKALALVAVLDQSIAELSRSIALRSDLIEAMREGGAHSKLASKYFGLRADDGSMDQMFHDAVVSLKQYVDDVAFFAAELAEETQATASEIRIRALKLDRSAPKISSVDFSKARSSGLLPPRSAYEDWLSGFRKQL